MKNRILFLTRSALIAAIYFALSVALQPFAFGPIQFRLSEMLVLLPVFMPSAIPGLAVGCFFTNFFFSPYGIYDMVFGVSATLIAAILTYLLRKNIILASLPPMILNALLVPLIWVVDGTDLAYFLNAAFILASEAIIVGVIGIPFTLMLKKALLRAGLIKVTNIKSLPYRRIPKEDRDSFDEDEF